MDSVSRRLKEERQLRGWSQRDLARETGVNADTISGIETDQHEPRPSTLRKLAKGLDVEVADFFREPALTGKAEAPREAGPQAGRRPNSAYVVASLRDHAQIFRALADRLASGLEQVRPEELPALVIEAVWVANGASKMMAENVAPLLEDARPEELEAGKEAERALEAIESVVYAIGRRAERHNAALVAGVEDELLAWRLQKSQGLRGSKQARHG